MGAIIEFADIDATSLDDAAGIIAGGDPALTASSQEISDAIASMISTAIAGLSGGSGLSAIANLKLLANISGISAVPSENTLTALIDACIGGTQGGILYRNASVWTQLAPGTATQVLTTGGSSANPSWQTPAGGGGSSQWTAVFKTADESKASNSTFGDDPFLTFPVAANTKYAFRGKLFFNSASATPGFKSQITGPASPTKVRIKRDGIIAGGTAYSAVQVDSAFSTSMIFSAGGGDGIVEFNGFLQNGANAGNVTVQWAQNSANSNPTILYAGSYIESSIVV